MRRNRFGLRAGAAAAVAGLLLLLGGGAVFASDAPRPRVAFDRPGGFTVRQGEEATLTATLEGGSGGMWFSWEGNNAGTVTGDGGVTFVIDTSVPGDYWLRTVGGSDGTDGDYAGKIRFRVAAKEGVAVRGAKAAGAGETTLLSEDFSGMTSGSSTDVGTSGYNGWTGSKMYNGTGCLKLGSGSAAGSAQSPVVANAGSAGRLEYSLKQYGSESTTVTVSYSTDGGTSWTSLASHESAPSSMTAYSVDFGASQTVRFKWEASGAGKRFYLDDVGVYAAAAVVEENQPPVIDLEPSDTAVELTLGDSYELWVTATELEGDTISMETPTGLPNGATWSADGAGTGSVQGLFEWTPTAIGTYTVVFSATDKDGTGTETVTFTVVPEGPGTLDFLSTAVNARENSTATLTVVRTGGAAGAVTVAWATANGTATAGSDYTAGSGTLTFAAGETSKSLTVAVLDDSAAENNETFTVTLSNPTGGAVLGAATVCTVTIIDDDDANADYYASCYSNGALKTGSTLKDALCKIINTGVTTNTYGSGLDTILKVIDACPTNKNLVQCIYLQRGISSFNKEHIWAQSHGIDERNPGYSDLHHIRASNSDMNSKRGNLDFDNCQGKSGAVEYNGCYYISSMAWEPPDSAKGDVARAMLYMDVRYENKYNSKYDLELVESIPTSTTGNQFGKLSTLLAWHELDPVDAFETNRNELIYTTYQGNRNPFIDHPDWVTAVFDPDNYVPATVEWTINVTINGVGTVNQQSSAFTTTVTNGGNASFGIQPYTWEYYHIGSVSTNGTPIAMGYDSTSYFSFTWAHVSDNGTLSVVFAPDLAALGTPIPWLVQYGSGETSVANEQWDTAELEDWNDDGVPNWQEYVNGTDPTALSLRQVTGVTVTAASASGFTVGWNALDYVDGYRVRVCSTAVVDAASAGFESGSLDAGWSTNTIGTLVATGSALEGSYGLAFSASNAWLCSSAVENPSAVVFKYKRSSNTNAWTLVVEVSADGTRWTEAGSVTNATTTTKTANVDLSAWYGQTVFVRLRDARESGSAARYVDAVTVRTGGATVAEGTPTGTSWTASGLSAGTEYDVVVRGEATTLGTAVGPWSDAVRATTATDDSGRTEQTITFLAIADQIATATVQLGATASSGLAVTYALDSGPAVLTGTMLTFTGAGTVSVTASQAGNEEYAPAVSVTRTFAVSLAPQSITFAEIADQVETATVQLSATADSGLAMSFAVTSGPAVLDGTTLSFTGTGTVTVTASQGGNALWAAAADVTRSFEVTEVTLDAPAEIWASSTNSAEFTAAWSAVDGATGYELTVWTAGEGTTSATTNETLLLSTNFAGVTGSAQITAGFDGWTYTSLYASNGAVRLGTRNAQGSLTSPEVEVHGTLCVISTARAWTGDTGPMWVEVDGMAQSNELTTSYAVFTNEFVGLDGGYSIVWRTTAGTQHRVLMTSVEATEVTVTEGTTGGIVPVTGYEAKPVAGTSCVVTGLDPETTYGFHARATAGSATGAWSATGEVTTWAARQAQTITFGSIANQTIGDTVTLTATASSGLSVAYSVTGPATLSGNVLTCTGVGNVTVTASQSGNEQYAVAEDVSQSFTVAKRAQTITFGAIANQTVGDTVTLAATANSGLTVAYSVTGPATLSGNVLTCTGAGNVTVTASQSGNEQYEAAEDVSQSFTVTKRTQTITFNAIGNQVATSTVMLSATADSGLDVIFVVTSGPAAVDGSTMTFTGVGEVTVTATQAGNGTYAAASESQTFTVAKATQSIDFDAIAGKSVGDTVNLNATASSGLAVGYAVSGPATLEGDTLTCAGAGTVTVTASQDGNDLYEAATSVVQSFEVSLLAQTIEFTGIGNQVATNVVTLSATASSRLDVTFAVTSGAAEVNGTTLSFTGAGEVTVTATQEGNTTYAPVTASQTFTVTKAVQNIDFDAIAGQSVGNTVNLNATANSGLVVSYTVSGPATLEGNTLTCTGAGTVTVTASQGGNDLYEAAESVMRTFAVSLVAQTIEFTAIGDQIATATVTLSATTSSGLDVTFAVTSGPAAVDGSTMTFTGAGEVTVTATQAGNETYAAASESQTFSVTKATQNIDFPTIAGQSVGDRVTLGATASSGLVVSYVVDGPVSRDGDTLTCTGAGTVTVTASQGGSDIWDAAADVTQTFEVSLVSQSIAFEAIGNQVATNTVTLVATADSGLDVTFAVTSGPALVDGSTLTFTGVGEVTVTVSQAGDATYASSTASQTFTVTKATQSINFDSIAGKLVGDTVTLDTTASSGLAISYTVSGPATLSGNVVSCTGAGTVTVTASQGGNALYAAAADVVQTFEVALVSQTITFDTIGNQVATNIVTLSATADSGLDVTFIVASGPAEVNGTMLTFMGAGEVTVTASQAGNGTYAPASATQTFTVSKATQTITFDAIVGQSVGDAVVLNATASSGLAVGYEVSGSATLEGNTLTCIGAGTVTVTASQDGNDLYEAATSVAQSFEVSLLAQTIEFTGIGNQVATNVVTLSATASSGLEVTFAVTSGPAVVEGATLAFTGAGEVTVMATQAGDETYASATASQTFTVTKATQSIDFPAIEGQSVGDKVTLGATASSGLSVSYVVDGPVSRDGDTLTCTGAGTVTVTASQGGSDIWDAAADVTQTFEVSLVTQSIAFETIGDQVASNVVTLSATADSGLDVTFAVTSGPAEVNGMTLTFTGAGEVTVMASQAGNGTYAPASATQTFTVSKATQTITFDAIVGQSVGDAVVLNATASSGLAVGYEVSGSATLEGNTLTCIGAGTVTVTASQDGNDLYEAATSVAQSFEVSLLAQTIEFTAIDNQITTNTVTLSATTDSGLPVTFAVASGPAEVNGTTLTFTGAGEVTVTVSQAGDATYASATASQTFTVSKATQSIVFDAIAGQSVGNTVNLNATANSGLVVSYTVSGPATLEGNKLTCTGAGTVTVTASQTGNDLYEAAESVTRTFEVSLVAQTIEFTAIGNHIATDTVTLFASVNSGLPVTFAVESGPAEVNGSTLIFTGAGEVTVTATQAGNGTYAEATAGQTFTVSKATQSIVFDAIAGQSVGDTVNLNAMASSGLAVSYTVSGPATLDGATLTCTGAGTVTVTASQAGNDLYEAAESVTRTFEVSLVSQTIEFTAIEDQIATAMVTLSATASSGLDVGFAVTSGPAVLNGPTLTFTGAGEVTVTASQTGNATYASATASQTFTVAKATQSIDFPAIAGQSVGDTVTLGATASSGLAVSYAVSGPATIVGNVVICTGAGTVTVTASQDGNAIYEAASPAEQSFEVSLVAQTIEFTAIWDQVATNIVTLSATADSGLDVTFTVTSGPAEVNGTTLTFTGAGEVTVTASQVGNETYASASESQTFTVRKAAQNIDFPPIAGQSLGDTVTLGAMASSGLAVGYAVSGPATLEGNTLTCTGAGTVTVTASQNGSDLYEAAESVTRTFEVSLMAQTIEFTAIGNQVATNAVTLSATADSGLDVTFIVASGPAEVNGTMLTFMGAGEVTVTVSQAGNNTYASAAASQTFIVEKATAEVTLSGLEQVYDGEAKRVEVTTEPAGLAVVVTYDGSEEAPVGAGEYAVVAVIEDAIWAGSAEGMLVVSKGRQSIEFGEIGAQIATNSVVLGAVASSGLEVSYAVEGPGGLVGNVLTFTGSGIVTVTAKQEGNENWEAAADVMRSFEVLEPELEKSEYEIWLEGLGLDVADYPESRVEDGDEDGMSNWAEFVAGTNPSEKTNFFAISAGSMAGGVLRLEAHPVLPDRVYSMVYWTNLLAPPQTNVLGSGFGSLTIETNVPGTWFGTIRVRLSEP